MWMSGAHYASMIAIPLERESEENENWTSETERAQPLPGRDRALQVNLFANEVVARRLSNELFPREGDLPYYPRTGENFPGALV
jgi:hypothetical protein